MAVFPNMISFNPDPRTAQGITEQCVTVNCLLANEGTLDIYGHVSIRNPKSPGTFFQSRRIAPGLVTQRDIMGPDLGGNVVSNKRFQHSTEISMHGEIYKVRPDANAICHNHAKELIPFSSIRAPLRPIPQTTGMFYRGAPAFHSPAVNSGLSANTRKVCQKLAQVLGDYRAAFIGVHGVVVIGESVVNLITGCTVLRDNVVFQFQVMQPDSPRYLIEEEGRAAMGTMLSPESEERTWSYWLNWTKNTLANLYW